MNKQYPYRIGVTLVELLVVITIIAIVTALAIPRLRMVTEDRAAREAGRIAGSTFAKAAQQAVTDGTSGVVIELNGNIFDQDNVLYAGTVLYMSKAVPSYSGDSFNAQAEKMGDFVLRIPRPIEQDARAIVLLGDEVTVNNGATRYRIMGISNFDSGGFQFLDLALSSGISNVAAIPPLPGIVASSYPFVIHRQPRIQESSRVELPEGYLIDMRYSGELIGDMPYDSMRAPLPFSGALPRRTIFHEPWPVPLPLDPTTPRNRQTQIRFGSDGSINHYRHYPTGDFRVPQENLFFFISKFEIDPNREQVLGPVSPIDNPTNLWLVINRKSGAATISYNSPPPPGPFAQRVVVARRSAIRGIAAND